MIDNEIDVAERHNITQEFLQVLISSYRSDSRVAKFLNDKKDLSDQVFVK
jgi:hypothetical protein